MTNFDFCKVYETMFVPCFCDNHNNGHNDMMKRME